MSKVRLLVFIMIIAGLVFGGLWYLDRSLRESPNKAVGDVLSFHDGNIDWYQDRSKTFTLAVFKNNFQLAFTAEDAQSLAEQAKDKNFSLAANAGYFKGSNITAEHVGLLVVNGMVEEPLVNDSQRQLTQVAIQNSRTGDLNFVTTQNLDVRNLQHPEFTAFQSGPLILNDNVVQFSEINDSLNGNGRFARTVLGYTDSGEKFIMISRVSTTLEDLASKIIKLDVFAGKKVSALNLDGGSSTAIYSPSFTDVNFGEIKRLPAIIGVVNE